MPDGGPGANEIEHIDALFRSLGLLYAFCISNYFPSLIGIDLDGHEKIIKETCESLKKFHDSIVDQRIRLWRESGIDGETREPQDLLDELISVKDADGNLLLTPEEIKAQTTEIMIATVDNPSNSVEWIFVEMMNNLEILKNATDEIDKVVGKEIFVEESDIPQLNYLKCCIREAFRLHPIAPFNVPHVAMDDTTIAGYFIPKGSHILLSRQGLGRNPKTWNEPLKFKRERHLDGKASEVMLTEPDLRFLSFSSGRRGCVASSLGTTMSVMVLARLLQGFIRTKPHNVSSIELEESKNNLFLASPLVLHAEQRLAKSLYPTN
ncbi:hypothetical protein LUZ60_016439 [Juncus effusus]|nr:hypothetical protein LUZ60_016439 [Juncus effusus]